MDPIEAEEFLLDILKDGIFEYGISKNLDWNKINRAFASIGVKHRYFNTISFELLYIQGGIYKKCKSEERRTDVNWESVLYLSELPKAHSHLNAFLKTRDVNYAFPLRSFAIILMTSPTKTRKIKKLIHILKQSQDVEHPEIRPETFKTVSFRTPLSDVKLYTKPDLCDE